MVANATHDGTEVQNDFDSIYPWSDIKTYNYNTTTNQITAFIGEPTFKFDGTNGEVMTRFPEFWYKREQKEGYEYIYIADYAEEGFAKSEQFSVGRYPMSGDETKVHSRSGYEPFVNKTIEEYRTYARELGEGFEQLDWHYFVLQFLYLVEYADYNVQNKLGQGIVNKGSSETSGNCDELEMKSGCVANDGLHSVIYRGVEDIFGNIWQFIDGINISNYQAYVCYDSSKYAVDTFDGDYCQLGYINANANGYISKIGYDENHPLILLPIEIEGSDNTGICDYCYSSEGNKIVIVGGWRFNWF